MPVDAAVDAALAGLIRVSCHDPVAAGYRELGCIRPPPGKALRPSLSLSQPAARYAAGKTH